MEVKQIQDTPFSVVTNEEQKTFITLGNYAVMQAENAEHAEKLISEHSWELMINVMCITTEIYNKNENNTKRTTKKQRSAKSN